MYNLVEDMQSRWEDSISSSKVISLVEMWGQAVFQDGGSADNGISPFPDISLMYK